MINMVFCKSKHFPEYNLKAITFTVKYCGISLVQLHNRTQQPGNHNGIFACSNALKNRQLNLHSTPLIRKRLIRTFQDFLRLMVIHNVLLCVFLVRTRVFFDFASPDQRGQSVLRSLELKSQKFSETPERPELDRGNFKGKSC